MHIERSRSTIQGDGPAAIAYPEISPYIPTDIATRLAGCVMTTMLLVGTQPGEARTAESFELGSLYRLESVIAKTPGAAREAGWKAEPISTRLDTPIGDIQRFPLTLAFSRKDLKKELKDAGSIILKTTTTSDGRERTVAERVVTANNIAKPSTVNMHSSEKSGNQEYADDLGILWDTRDSLMLPLSPMGVNKLYVTKKRDGKTTTKNQVLADPASKACGESRVIQTDIASPYAIKSLCKAITQTRPFITSKPIIVLKARGADEAVFSSDADNKHPGVLNLRLPFKRNIGTIEIGSALPKHELSHVIFADLPEIDQDALAKDYDALARAMTYRIPTEDDVLNSQPGKYYDTADNEPVWATITESHYERELGNIGSLSGHPFDNTTEMFASSIAVYSTYGEQFVAQFNKLNPYQQDIHRQLFTTITDILRKRATSSDPMDDITHLIPDYWYISQALFCSKPQGSSANNS